jgi:hypothetical protein
VIGVSAAIRARRQSANLREIARERLTHDRGRRQFATVSVCGNRVREFLGHPHVELSWKPWRLVYKAVLFRARAHSSAFIGSHPPQADTPGHMTLTADLPERARRSSAAISSVTSREAPAEALNATIRTGLAVLGRLGLQRTHISDEVIELGVGRHVAGVHLLGGDVPHELDRVAQRRGAPIVEVGRG